jgi:hypothetical protein
MQEPTLDDDFPDEYRPSHEAPPKVLRQWPPEAAANIARV